MGSSAWHAAIPIITVASGTTVTNSATMQVNGIQIQTGGTALSDVATAAVYLAVQALELPRGSEVLVSPISDPGTYSAIILNGLIPRLVDSAPGSYNVGPDQIKERCTTKSKAILLVHAAGQPAKIDKISILAKNLDLRLIEDCSQAHGAHFNGQKVGTFGLFSAFSFYATKNMTTGEGGMIVTRDSSLAEKARLLRNQGMITAHNNEIVGFNNRMTDIAAAIGRVQLRKLEEMTKRREEIASEFNDRLSGVTIPFKSERVRHVYHQYTVRVENRDEVMSRLEKKAIKTGIYYRTPVHRLPSFMHKCSLPQTDLASEEVLSIPVFPSLAQSEIDRIVEGVNG